MDVHEAGDTSSGPTAIILEPARDLAEQVRGGVLHPAMCCDSDYVQKCNPPCARAITAGKHAAGTASLHSAVHVADAAHPQGISAQSLLMGMAHIACVLEHQLRMANFGSAFLSDAQQHSPMIDAWQGSITPDCLRSAQIVRLCPCTCNEM